MSIMLNKSITSLRMGLNEASEVRRCYGTVSEQCLERLGIAQVRFMPLYLRCLFEFLEGQSCDGFLTLVGAVASLNIKTAVGITINSSRREPD
jgi:hypothetical protein